MRISCMTVHYVTMVPGYPHDEIPCGGEARFVVCGPDDGGWTMLACATCALTGFDPDEPCAVRVFDRADRQDYLLGTIDAAIIELSDSQLQGIAWGCPPQPASDSAIYEIGWDDVLTLRAAHLWIVELDEV